MQYSCDINIALPRQQVVALFDDASHYADWQEGLLSHELVEGQAGTVGAKSRIRQQMGKRVIEMTETIAERNLPDSTTLIYEAPGVWNSVASRFSDDAEGGTHWHIDCEFRCSGFLRLMAWLMPGMFKKQTQKMMTDFRDFAVSQATN